MNKKDYKKAFETIKKCADKGHLPAIYDLGANFYYNGNGTEKNDKLAEYYLRIAKEAGIVKAVEDATMYVRTGEWVKATATEYEKAQNGNKKPKGEM